MTPGTPIDFAEDYENLAQRVAEHFGRPVPPNIIRALMTGYHEETIEAIEAIEANPHLFNALVKLHLLAALALV